MFGGLSVTNKTMKIYILIDTHGIRLTDWQTGRLLPLLLWYTLPCQLPYHMSTAKRIFRLLLSRLSQPKSP